MKQMLNQNRLTNQLGHIFLFQRPVRGNKGLSFDRIKSVLLPTFLLKKKLRQGVWEIEITGGVIAEADDAPDYTYQDLVDFYWPASIAAVQYYTDDITLDYVGHSNGCRVALSSLNDYQETGKSSVAKVQDLSDGTWEVVDMQGASDAHVVDTFIGVACPITLNENSQMSNKARKLKDGVPKGDIAIDKIRDKELGHVYRQDYGKHLTWLGNFFGRTKERISTNLMDFYNSLSINENDVFVVNANLFEEVILFAGTNEYYKVDMLEDFEDDGVVPVSDMVMLNNSLDNSDLHFMNDNHGKIIESNKLKDKILERLNG